MLSSDNVFKERTLFSDDVARQETFGRLYGVMFSTGVSTPEPLPGAPNPHYRDFNWTRDTLKRYAIVGGQST